MKTAEEYLSNHGLACEYGYNVDVIPVSIALEAMKLYANAKLDEAAEQLGNHPAYFNEIQSYQHDKQSILSLKDKI